MRQHLYRYERLLHERHATYLSTGSDVLLRNLPDDQHRSSKLWRVRQFLPHQLDVYKWCVRLRLRLQAMWDNLHCQQSVLHQQCSGLPNRTGVLQWNLHGHEHRCAELRDLRHGVPGDCHVQCRIVRLHHGIQAMWQPVRCDLDLLHERLAQHLPERADVL